jgi:hypothetical protein
MKRLLQTPTNMALNWRRLQIPHRQLKFWTLPGLVRSFHFYAGETSRGRKGWLYNRDRSRHLCPSGIQ